MQPSTLKEKQYHLGEQYLLDQVIKFQANTIYSIFFNRHPCSHHLSILLQNVTDMAYILTDQS